MNLTAEAMDRLASIRERLAKATDGPWVVRQSYGEHRAGSGRCRETCGTGESPRRVWADAAGLERLREGGHDKERRWSEEMHEEPAGYFEEILGSDGKVIVGVGQDYDDRGTPASDEDADFIAHAPDDMAWLLARLDAAPGSPAIAAPAKAALAPARARRGKS
jgi:hypothetical protein